MSTKEQPLYKHIFIEYGEYERLLELKKRNEELIEKTRTLENRIKSLEQDRVGHGLQEILAKEAKEKVNPPLIGTVPSITLPPSTSTEALSSVAYPWYFLGIPKVQNESK